MPVTAVEPVSEANNTEPPTQEIAPEALESQTENPPATEEEAEEEEDAPQTGDAPTPEESAWNQVKGTSIAFPMARVKKIIKADPDVRTVNKEATMLIAKTTELVVMKLAEASMQAAHRGKRKTINYNDILSAVQEHGEFEFLEGTVKAGAGENKLRTAKKPDVAVGEKRAAPDENEVDADDSGQKQMKMDDMFGAKTTAAGALEAKSVNGEENKEDA